MHGSMSVADIGSRPYVGLLYFRLWLMHHLVFLQTGSQSEMASGSGDNVGNRLDARSSYSHSRQRISLISNLEVIVLDLSHQK